MAAPIFVISGPPGAGKSSVARALAMRYPFGMHIPIDDLREWVVAGVAHPVPAWTDETSRQFHLARTGAARLARLYAQAGFAVVLDDVMFPEAYDQSMAPELRGLRVVRIVLLPAEAIAQQRNRERTGKSFTPSFLVETIRDVHASMQQADFAAAGWHVLDNSSQSLEETVQALYTLW